MTETEKLKMELMSAYFEVQHLSEATRKMKNAGITAYLKCAVSFIDAALETLKMEEDKDGE